MAANRRSTWRFLAALLLLVTVPAAGSLPALPPPAPKADLVSADLLADVAGLDHEEILALVAFVVPEESSSWAAPHRKTRVWGSNLGGDTQPTGESWFKGEIAVGVLVVRFYHADGLGSVRVLTDEAGTVTDRYSFTAFGELLEHVGDDPNAYLFAGEPLDPNSGFYYNRARWMDPSLGVFLAMDPFSGFLLEPVSLHKYLYVQANPVNFVDPSGEITGVANIAVTGAVISAVAGGFINAIGANTPSEFAGRFLIGAMANGIATYLAFLVANPLAQGAIAGGLSHVFTLLWESRRDIRSLMSGDTVMEVLVASLIGAFAGGIVAKKFRHMLIPKHRDLWQNVWKARNIQDFTVNIRHALLSGAVGGALTTELGRQILPHVRTIPQRIGLFSRSGER